MAKNSQRGLSQSWGHFRLNVSHLFILLAKKLSTFHCLDLTVLGGSIGIFLGRIANFINGELFGRVIEKKAWISVQFPQEMLIWLSDKNTQALQNLGKAVGKLKNSVTIDMWQSWVYQFETTGQQKSQIYSAVYSLIKAVEKGNQEVILSLKPVLSHRYPSQIYQAF